MSLDGKAASRRPRDRHILFVKPGAHRVAAVFADGQQATERVIARAGHSASLEVAAPPPLPAKKPTGAGAPIEHRGISSGWFIAGAVVTVALGGATVYEGLGTLADRDHIRELTAGGDQQAAQRAYDDARGRQTLTNVLIGATAVAGVATITAAYLAHRSSGERPRQEVTIAPTPGGATIGYAATF